MSTPEAAQARMHEEARQRLAQEPWKSESALERDPLRLIHELRVHQIELEMQNEVLTETLASVNALRAKYLDLYDTAPVGYLTLDATGRILELNLRAAGMLSEARENLIGRPLRHFFEPNAVAALDTLLQGATQGSEELAAPALQISRNLPVPLYVNALARRSVDTATGQPQTRLVLMDVSALKMATDDVVKTLTAGLGQR